MTKTSTYWTVTLPTEPWEPFYHRSKNGEERPIRSSSRASPGYPAYKRRCPVATSSRISHATVRRCRTTDRVDWPTEQQNDPVVGEIYRAVCDKTAPPTPDAIAHHNAEIKSLYSQIDRLSISDAKVLYRMFTNLSTGQTNE